jgi:hypothetical protein
MLKDAIFLLQNETRTSDGKVMTCISDVRNFNGLRTNVLLCTVITFVHADLTVSDFDLLNLFLIAVSCYVDQSPS